MGKKYKGKPCVYCVRATSTTADHVIGREFFLLTRRDNLPIVPACESCNREKSRLEHYLTAVMGFGGRHTDAAVNLATLVRRRILKNAKLYSELAAGFARSGGTAVPIDHNKVEKLFAMIAQGLLWYHWQVLLGPGYSATAGVFSVRGEFFFNRTFDVWNTPNRIKRDLGEGTFRYEGAQATDSPQSSVWRFSMYGGVIFGGGPQQADPAPLAVAVTGSDTLIRKLHSRVFAVG
jgi:hypothetical protein